jgi:membrane protein
VIRAIDRLDRWQQRHRSTAIAVAAARKFSDDRGTRLAALIAFYGFYSLFPAMLAFVTVLGFVLGGRPGLRAELADSALAQLPIVGSSIGDAVNRPLRGSPLGLVVGLIGALWGGLSALQATQDALNDVWDVPRRDHPGFLAKRRRSLFALAALALFVLASTVLTASADWLGGGMPARALILAPTIAVNILAYALLFRILQVVPTSWRQSLPGAVAGGVAYTLAQLAGGVYVKRTLRVSEETYGTFALVIGLLSWLVVVAIVTIAAAEINATVARKLWPRSLRRTDRTTADKASLAAQATEQAAVGSMEVEVSFDTNASSRATGDS